MIKNINHHWVAGLALPLISQNAFSAVTKSPQSSGFSVIGGLILVLIAVFACAWILKRTSKLVGGDNANLMSVLSSVAVGPKERVVALEVAGKLVIVGVTTNQVSLIANMDMPIKEWSPESESNFDEVNNMHPKFSGNKGANTPFSSFLNKVIKRDRLGWPC